MSDFDHVDDDGFDFDSLSEGSSDAFADDPGPLSGDLWTQPLDPVDTDPLNPDVLPDPDPGPIHQTQPRFGQTIVVNDSREPASVLLVPRGSVDAAVEALVSQGITPYGAMTGADGAVEVNPLVDGASSHGADGEE